MYVEKNLGKAYVQIKLESIAEIFENSQPHFPLIYILSTGADPLETIKTFAKEQGLGDARKLKIVSMGVGQGEKA
jgi:dynein heavy chain